MKFACALVAALRLFSITEAADLRNQRDEYQVQVRQQPFGMIGKKNSAKSYFATVTGVKEHSPAMNAGVQVGSQIMAINGSSVSADDWEDRFRILKMPFTLTLRAPRSHDRQTRIADTLDKLEIEQAVNAAHDKDKDRLKKRLNKKRRQKIERKKREKNKKRRQKIERKKRRNVTVRERPFGIQFKKIAPSTLETWFPSLTGTLETYPVTVIGVVKDSPADKARVRVGSELVAINGTEVTSNNWERHFDAAALPFTLTLKGGTNPLFAEPEDSSSDDTSPATEGACLSLGLLFSILGGFVFSDNYYLAADEYYLAYGLFLLGGGFMLAFGYMLASWRSCGAKVGLDIEEG